MYNILNNLLIENGFKESSSGIFNLNTSDSLILIEYTETEIVNFFDESKTKEILNRHNENVELNPSLKKSTNLLAYVKVKNIADSLTRLKNTIFTIEEDEYYFRKSVFLYSDGMTETIDIDVDIKTQLNSIVDKGDIDKLRENGFYDLVYYFALQLFIKLPWLNFDIERTEFELIEKPLSRKILENGLDKFDQTFDQIDDGFMDSFIEKNKSDKANIDDFQNLIKLFGDK